MKSEISKLSWSERQKIFARVYDRFSTNHGEMFRKRCPQPLSLGIRESLYVRYTPEPFSKLEIYLFLGLWVRRYEYYRAVSKGENRFGLDGNASPLTDEHKEFAEQKIEHMKRKKKA